MGRPRSGAHKIPTTERILRAAEIDFGQNGFAGARLGDIAKVAKIRRPSLLYHFETKEVLYAAVVQRIFGTLLERLLTATQAEGDFRFKVMALMQALIDFLDERPTAAKLVLREMIDGIGPGREILEQQMVPVLDTVEAFLASSGASTLPNGVDIRHVIMMLASDAMVYHASGPLRRPMWGSTPNALALAERLLVESN